MCGSGGRGGHRAPILSGLLPPAGPAQPRGLGPGGIPGVVVDHHPVAEAQRLAGGERDGDRPTGTRGRPCWPSRRRSRPRPGSWRRTAPGARGCPGGRARTRPRAGRRPCPTGRTTATAAAPPGRARRRRRARGGCRASRPDPGGPAPSSHPTYRCTASGRARRRAADDQRHVPVDGVGVVVEGDVAQHAVLAHGDGPRSGRTQSRSPSRWRRRPGRAVVALDAPARRGRTPPRSCRRRRTSPRTTGPAATGGRAARPG